MTFQKTVLASVSLGVFLTGSFGVQAMHSAATSEEGASARSASRHSQAASEQASLGQMESSYAARDAENEEAAPQRRETVGHTRITPAIFLEPGRTPLLKEKRFVPWNPTWDLLSDENHKHLAIDSLGRLVDEANPIHRFMARKSLEIYYSLVPPPLGSRISFLGESPACRSLDQLRGYLKERFQAGDGGIARRFSEIFQETWNRKVDAAEAVAARNLQIKEAARLQDLELRRELMDIIVPEFEDPTLYPRAVEERQRFLASKDDWSPDISARELMGRVLLERGRSCFAHCLRHPVLGPRLLEEVLRPWSPADFELLTSVGTPPNYQELEDHLEPVFPENTLPISEESQAEVARFFRHARMPSEILAVRNSVHGPALMSQTSLERVYDNISGPTLAGLARLLPNMTDFTWIFGSGRPLTSDAVAANLIPFVGRAPETLQRLTIKHEGEVKDRDGLDSIDSIDEAKAWVAEVNAERARPLAIEWIEESVPLEQSPDSAYLHQLLKQEMHRHFLDARRGIFTFGAWSWDRFVERELTTDAPFGSFNIHEFILNFEGANLRASGLFYDALQALVQGQSEGELGAIDLSPLHNVLDTHVWQAFQERQAIEGHPYRVDFDEQGTLLSLEPYPNIPLRRIPAHLTFVGNVLQAAMPMSFVLDGEVTNPVSGFSYLSPRLQEMLQKIRAEGRPIPASISTDAYYFSVTSEPHSPERALLEYAGLFNVEDRARA